MADTCQAVFSVTRRRIRPRPLAGCGQAIRMSTSTATDRQSVMARLVKRVGPRRTRRAPLPPYLYAVETRRGPRADGRRCASSVTGQVLVRGVNKSILILVCSPQSVRRKLEAFAVSIRQLHSFYIVDEASRFLKRSMSSRSGRRTAERCFLLATPLRSYAVLIALSLGGGETVVSAHSDAPERDSRQGQIADGFATTARQRFRSACVSAGWPPGPRAQFSTGALVQAQTVSDRAPEETLIPLRLAWGGGR